MKKILFLSVLSLSALAADIDKRPPAFKTQNSQAVFADFTNAYYEITYNIPAKTAEVVAHIDLTTAEEGQVIFDSLQEPTKVILNGEETSAALLFTPNKETLIRAVNKTVPAGLHHLQVNIPMSKDLMEFSPNGVKNAFWMSDLSDRGYLERYLPTNFAYDRIPMTLKLNFVGTTVDQSIYTNGDVTKIASNQYKIIFRKNFNATCPYFHTTPVGSFAERRFSVRSIDGRELPAVIYLPVAEAARLPGLQDKLVTIIDELEKDYGPFLHPSLTVYINAPAGGMEHSGATITSESALGHELFHSYFARGVLPAEGNAGWIDEALASWRDKGYSSIPTLQGTSKIADLGTYTRLTDRLAYSFGERFMSLLNNKFAAQGGLKAYLRVLIEKKAFDPIFVNDMISGMNSFYGTDVNPLFNRYVMGQGSVDGEKSMKAVKNEKYHRQFSIEELRNML